MTRNKYGNIFVLLLLMVAVMASCQAKEQDKDADLSTLGPLNIQDSFLDSFPKPIGYVNDYEDLFNIAEEKTLDSLIAGFEKKTTIQIAVVTIDTNMTTAEHFDAFTLKLANAWGIGQKEKNNGVLIGICKGYKKLKVQNGLGIEKVLTNEETKQIVDANFIPSFRKAEYFEGTKKGLQALMGVLTDRYR